ncbi:collagen alpha-1(II) chain-like isoform X14 [Tympanuchus pallidicinctus]|uniref:collagen alpha-1(II) chain-like isoform X14 n=1 Tax=Tympanuchus pallidicinctus TaxID=109042 RepID=UPI002286D2DC|nr:collagen alpha-1(II) chain-like isoform X14 [Tympanuchus pallidicinctus]
MQPLGREAAWGVLPRACSRAPVAALEAEGHPVPQAGSAAPGPEEQPGGDAGARSWRLGHAERWGWGQGTCVGSCGESGAEGLCWMSREHEEENAASQRREAGAAGEALWAGAPDALRAAAEAGGPGAAAGSAEEGEDGCTPAAAGELGEGEWGRLSGELSPAGAGSPRSPEGATGPSQSTAGCRDHQRGVPGVLHHIQRCLWELQVNDFSVLGAELGTTASEERFLMPHLAVPASPNGNKLTATIRTRDEAWRRKPKESFSVCEGGNENFVQY